MGYRCWIKDDLRHCTVTGMNIDTYADQNNIKYPNKIKLIKLAVEWMKSDDFLYILREKKRTWMHVFVLESVRDFYNFRVNPRAILREWNTELVIFQGGPDPLSPPLDPHLLTDKFWRMVNLIRSWLNRGSQWFIKVTEVVQHFLKGDPAFFQGWGWSGSNC